MGLAPPPSAARRSELADFLRDRRARVTPDSVGLAGNGSRRTPGLRREEVAQLAGVGLSWYTWLEQGRDIKVSEQVLDAMNAFQSTWMLKRVVERCTAAQAFEKMGKPVAGKTGTTND